MTMFPGDMNIGLGFGVPDEDEEDERVLAITPKGLAYLAELEAKEQGPTDPLLAVSELEQKVTDLEERLRNATIVISGQVDSIELLFDQQNSQNERLNSVEEHVERALFGIDRHEEVLDAQNHRLNSIESLLSTWTQK